MKDYEVTGNFNSVKHLIHRDQWPLEFSFFVLSFFFFFPRLSEMCWLILWTQRLHCLPGSVDVLIYNCNIPYSNSWEHVPETDVICQVRVYKDGMGERIQMEEQHSYLPEESLRKPCKCEKKLLLPIISSLIPIFKPKWWVTRCTVIRIYCYDLVLLLIGPEAGNSTNLPGKPSPLGFLVSVGIPVRFGSVFI